MHTRLDRDQLALERSCSHLSNSRAIKAVQIWIRKAFAGAQESLHLQVLGCPQEFVKHPGFAGFLRSGNP